METYTLYWNLNKALYSGKSEAGMSSRTAESDGYFHVRFFVDGEEITLKVKDRKVINAIDHEDLMGLEIDEDGFVTKVLSLDVLPLERVGWRFSVQNAARWTAVWHMSTPVLPSRFTVAAWWATMPAECSM